MVCQRCTELYCRSDMQRERSRERLERARRQWELEHCNPSLGASNSSLPRPSKAPSYEATVLHMVRPQSVVRWL